MGHIINLRDVEIRQVMDLFYDCFKDDPYYVEAFGAWIADMIYQDFGPVIEHIIRLGDSYGIKDGSDLIGFLIAFQYRKLKTEDEVLFRKVFDDAESDGALPYQKEIHDVLDVLQRDTMYFISIAVREDQRRKGLATELVTYLLENYGEFNIASDVSNVESLVIYDRLGFDLNEIDKIHEDHPYTFILKRRA